MSVFYLILIAYLNVNARFLFIIFYSVKYTIVSNCYIKYIIWIFMHIFRIGDMSGLISKAKEGLAKSKSKADVLKSPTSDNLPKLQETKKSENELHWEELVKKLKRPLALCDLDFTDLNSEDEIDVLGSANVTNGMPPPPPPMAPPNGDVSAPPPPPLGARLPPPLPQGPPLPFGISLKMSRPPLLTNETSNTPKNLPSLLAKKSKKTVKLFWKEVRDDPNILARLDKHKMIWDELTPVAVDTQKLEHLFESRAKDLITKVSGLMYDFFYADRVVFIIQMQQTANFTVSKG